MKRLTVLQRSMTMYKSKCKSDESNVSNLSFLELLFKKEKPKSKDIQKLFMKDTGVSTIFLN